MDFLLIWVQWHIDVDDDMPAQLDTTLPPARWRLLASIAVLFGFLLAQVLAGALWLGLAKVLGISWSIEPLDTAGAWLLVAVECTVAAAALLVMRSLAPWQNFGLVRGWCWRGWLALVPVIGVMVAPSMLVAAVGDKNLVAETITMQRAAAFVALAVAIAVAEELWFRGIMLERLGGVDAPLMVTMVSALFFGLPHAGNSPASWLNAAAVALAVGVPFALVWLRYMSLVPLIGWHAVIDIWAFIHTAQVSVSGSPSPAEIASGIILPSILAASYGVWFVVTRPTQATT